MSRRIELELTSSRDDGTWTWRAAGAKQPKGELDGSLLPSGSKVGDVLRADADFDIEGITVIGVLAPKGARREPERIEIIGPKRDEQLVTSTLVGKAGRGGRRDGGDRPDGPGRRENRRDRGNRGDRPDRGDRGDSRGGRPRADDAGSRRPSRGGATGDRPPRRERPARPPRPEPEPRPKAKRLRAGRAHRNEVLATLPEEQKPIAEQVLRGGIPAVRQAVDKQNEQARAAGTPEIKPEGLITIAEQLLPRLRTAEWHDRADAAMADVDEVALSDLRSVVVASDAAARDDTTRELAQQLRDALTRRVEEEHAAWLSEIAETLAGGRTVRALRLSSRPPKAGAPLPPDLSARLAEAASAGLTADTAPDRFATVLDALAYAPVRGVVTAQGIPAEPGDALLGVVRKLATRLPQIAVLFGIEAGATPPARGPRRGAKRVPAPPPRPAPTPIAPAEPAASEPAASEPESIAAAAPAEPAPTESESKSAPADPAPQAAATTAPAEAVPAAPAVEPEIEPPATATTHPDPQSDPAPAPEAVEAAEPTDAVEPTDAAEPTEAVESEAATAPAE